MLHFNGLKIIISDNAVEITKEPVKKHKLKPWHLHFNKIKARLPYHDRIQKKWNKRFGFVNKPCAYRTPTAIIMHPGIYSEFKKVSALQTEE